MSGDRLEVSVSFDPAKGYVATVPDLAAPITALSLAVLRRRIGAAAAGRVDGCAQPRPRRPPGARPAPSEDHRPIRRSRSRVPVIRPELSRNVVVPFESVLAVPVIRPEPSRNVRVPFESVVTVPVMRPLASRNVVDCCANAAVTMTNISPIRQNIFIVSLRC
jgi:hypothetical protein